MQRARTLLFCLLAFPLLASASCATTRLAGVWNDISFRGGQIKRILVAVIPDREMNRRLLEIAFASRLKENYGIDAVPSHVLIFSDKLEKELVAAEAKEQGFDAALVIRLTDQKTIERYYPGYPGGKSYYAIPWDYHVWGDKYYQGFPANTQPSPTAYMMPYKILSTEIDLYDIGAGRVIWSAQSDTVVRETFEREIESFVSTVVKALDEGDVLLPGR